MAMTLLSFAVYVAMPACADASPCPSSLGGSAAPFSALDGRPEAVSNEHQQGGLRLLMRGKPGRAIGDATSVDMAGREPPCPPESARPTTEPPNANPSRHPMSLSHDQPQSSRQDLKTRAGRDGEAVLRRVRCPAPPAHPLCVVSAHPRCRPPIPQAPHSHSTVVPPSRA